ADSRNARTAEKREQPKSANNKGRCAVGLGVVCAFARFGVRAVRLCAPFGCPRRLAVRAVWLSAPFGCPRRLAVRAVRLSALLVGIRQAVLAPRMLPASVRPCSRRRRTAGWPRDVGLRLRARSYDARRRRSSSRRSNASTTRD